jgi:hypothetical protein
MVNDTNRIDIAELVETDALLGRSQGELHLPLLFASILRQPTDAVVWLDFQGIENITASWVAATIVPLLRMRSAGSLGRYLLLNNLTPDLIEEVAYVLNHENTPALLLNPGREPVVLGPLDPAYAQTLERIHAQGHTTAKTLLEMSDERIGQTGWIKRLTTLNVLGLIRKNKVGREHTYEPLVEVTHG